MGSDPAAAWKVLLDPPRVASWLGIVKDVREVEPLRRYAAVLEDRVGPFALRADLAITIVVAEDARSLHVEAAGEDRQVASRITATVDVAIRSGSGGTVVDVTGRYEITGRLATLGAGAIRKKGEHVLDEFVTAVRRELAA